MNFAGQVAVITGAGSPTGIGFAIASALAFEGAAVVLGSTTDRIHQRVAELSERGAIASAIVGDLTQPGAAGAIIHHAIATHGRIDICVNNAGMVTIDESPLDARVHDISDHDWEVTLQRNLTTCFAVTRACLPPMIARQYGRIINVASTSGPVQAFVGDAAYHAAKAGMVGFTRATALEVAGEGITVNAVAPGWIATGSQTLHESRAGAATPMRRSGTQHEVAAAVRFLAHPSASYVTGHVLVVDGGNSLPEDRTWQPS